jgi:hypothetical protein
MSTMPFLSASLRSGINRSSRYSCSAWILSGAELDNGSLTLSDGASGSESVVPARASQMSNLATKSLQPSEFATTTLNCRHLAPAPSFDAGFANTSLACSPNSGAKCEVQNLICCLRRVTRSTSVSWSSTSTHKSMSPTYGSAAPDRTAPNIPKGPEPTKL